MSSLDQKLCGALRDLPRRFNKTYTPEARNVLLSILFDSLTLSKPEYGRLLFPNGMPEDVDGPWKLSEAQGAVEGAEYSAAAKGKRCGHIFRGGEFTYTCKTCTDDDTCVLCAKCFEASDHEGHQVQVQVSPGMTGCCDCGDTEAWSRPVYCSIHSDTDEHGQSLGDSAQRTSTLPKDLQDSIHSTIARALDYICDVFSCAPEQMRLPKSEDAIRQNEKMSRLNSGWYKRGADTDEDDEFALVLWNDEKHTHEEVANQVAKGCRKSRKYAKDKTYEIDEVGRSAVDRSRNVQELLQKATRIEQIKLTVTIRSTRDTFREDMCGTIIEWLSDIAGCSVGNDNHILMRSICDEMLRPWRIGSEAHNLEIAKEGLIDQQRSDDRINRMRQADLLRRVQMARRAGVPAQIIGTDGTQITLTIPPQNQGEPLENDDDDEDDEEDDDEGVMVETDLYVDEEDDGMDVDEEGAFMIDGDMNIVDLEGDDDDDDDDEIMVDSQQEDREASSSTRQSPVPSDRTAPAHAAASAPPNPNDLLSRIPKTPSRIPMTPKRKGDMQGPPGYWSETTNKEADVEPQSLSVHEDLHRRVRMDFLILYDMRMWKTLRSDLRHLYISTVITVPTFKRILGLRFTALYTWLSQLYLVADREPELSIINLTLQMLTTPSITAEVVRRGRFFTKLLAILYTFLTKRQVGHPEDVDPSATVAADAMNNRRILHFFQDMKYLLDGPYVKERIRTEETYLLQFIDTLKLFQGIYPTTRAVGEHVEYESEAWMGGIHIIKEVTFMSRQFCEAFSWTRSDDPSSICRAVRQTAKAVTINSLGLEHARFTLADLKSATIFHTIAPFEMEMAVLGSQAKQHTVVDFKVEKEPISFHHSLHYTLSWLIEAGKSMSRDQLQSLLSFTHAQLQWQDPRSTTKHTVPNLPTQQYLLAILDIPLRVCVLLAQIKAGLWVRNGGSLTAQGNTYRGYSHREATIQRDMFLLQVGCVICEPADFLASMIDRFSLNPWMSSEREHPNGFEEFSKMLDVAEDFLHLLIVLLSDRTLLIPPEDEPATMDIIAKRDIAHALCFKPITHSGLYKRLPNQVTDYGRLSAILDEVAEFREPKGMSDSGTFELRDEYFELVDPYYAFYTKNQREEAENICRSRLAKKLHQPVEETFLEPQLRSIPSGIFKSLGAITQTPTFSHIIATFVHFATTPDRMGEIPKTRVESFLQVLLHLISIAIREDSTRFPEPNPSQSFLDCAIHSEVALGSQDAQSTLYRLILLLDSDYGFKASHPKIRHVLRQFQERRPSAFENFVEKLPSNMSSTVRAGVDSPKLTDDVSFKKKQAMERQAKVMASFKQQQSLFMQKQTIDWGIGDASDEEDLDMTLGETTKKTWNFPSGNCIFCQEETDDQRLFGTLAALNDSCLFRETNLADGDYISEISITPLSLDCSADSIRPFGVAGQNTQKVSKVGANGKTISYERKGLGKGFPSSHQKRGPVATGCGHLMHYSCFEAYNEATKRRHSFQVARNHPERLQLKEFVCPLCKALGNAFLPIVWKPKEYSGLSPPNDFDQWISAQVPFLVSKGAKLPQYQKIFQNYTTDSFVPNLSSTLSEVPRSATQAPAGPQSTGRWLPQFLSSTEQHESRPFARRASAATGTSRGSATSSGAELMTAYRRLHETMRENRLLSRYRADEMNNFEVLASSLGYTIASIEIAQRGTHLLDNDGTRRVTGTFTGTFLDNVSEQSMTHLRILSETVSSYLAVGGLKVSRNLSEVGESSRLQIEQLFGQNDTSEPLIKVAMPLLSQDIFVFLTECSVFMVPHLHQDIHNVMRLCYLAEIVKVVVTILHDSKASWDHVHGNTTKLITGPGLDTAREKLDCTHEQGENFSTFVQSLLFQCRESLQSKSIESTISDIEENPNTRYKFDRWLRSAAMTYALPFLRKCLLLLNVRCGVDFSKEPTSPGASPVSELDRLSRILKLPSFDDLISSFVSMSSTSKHLQRITKYWIAHWSANLTIAHDTHLSAFGSSPDDSDSTSLPFLVQPGPVPKPSNTLRLSHPAIYELVPLPQTHDILNAEAIARRCPSTGREITDPIICLLCGEIFCGQAQCCGRLLAEPSPSVTSAARSPLTDRRNRDADRRDQQEGKIGGANLHMDVCTGGTAGLFLIIRKCSMLFLVGDGARGRPLSTVLDKLNPLTTSTYLTSAPPAAAAASSTIPFAISTNVNANTAPTSTPTGLLYPLAPMPTPSSPALPTPSPTAPGAPMQRQGGFFQAPYLDKHGEADPGLQRKEQLWLNAKRFDKLVREVWLHNGVWSVVARKLEGDVNSGGWETL